MQITLNDDIADLLVKYDRDDSIKVVLSNDPEEPTPYPAGCDYVLRFYDSNFNVLLEATCAWDITRTYATIYVSAEEVNQFFETKPASVRLLFVTDDDSTVVASGKVQQKKFGDSE